MATKKKAKSDKKAQKVAAQPPDIYLNVTAKERISEAHTQLQTELEKLYEDLENEALPVMEYYRDKIDSMECFISIVMKALNESAEKTADESMDEEKSTTESNPEIM